MRNRVAVASFLLLWAVGPSVAYAQRFPFERTFDVGEPSKIDVSTLRGKIEIEAGDAGRIVVAGEVTVRVGWDVPVNAIELARQVAANPPIDRSGDTLRLHRPSDEASQRAVTVSYRVRVPPTTEVRSTTDSGATAVRGVDGRVNVRTQSAAIDLSSLGGDVTVATGSGAVTTDTIKGSLAVITASSSFVGRRLGSSLRVRTQSGAVDAVLIGTGDVDVETGSSGIRLTGVRGGLTVNTQSGRITVQGAPRREWTATTSSSSVSLTIEPSVAFSLDATSRSGSVVVVGEPVQGSVAKLSVRGTVRGGGPLVRVNSGSGSIRVDAGGSYAFSGLPDRIPESAHSEGGRMKVVVLALTLSLGTTAAAFAQASQPNLGPTRLDASFESIKMQAAAGEKPGFTVFGNLGLGLQHDTYYEETAVGLAGSNFGVGMFVTNRLAVLGRGSVTIAQFDDFLAPTSQVSGVLGGSVQYWLNDRFSIEGGAGMGFWANDAGGFNESEQAFGIVAAVAGSVYKRGRHHVRISFEYAPAFTDFAVHNIGFTVGYQLVK